MKDLTWNFQTKWKWCKFPTRIAWNPDYKVGSMSLESMQRNRAKYSTILCTHGDLTLFPFTGVFGACQRGIYEHKIFWWCILCILSNAPCDQYAGHNADSRKNVGQYSRFAGSSLISTRFHCGSTSKTSNWSVLYNHGQATSNGWQQIMHRKWDICGCQTIVYDIWWDRGKAC